MPVKRRRFKFKSKDTAGKKYKVYPIDGRLKKYHSGRRWNPDWYWEPKCGYDVMVYSDYPTRDKVEKLGKKLKGSFVGAGCGVGGKFKGPPCDVQFQKNYRKGFTPEQALKFAAAIKKAGKVKVEVHRSFCPLPKKERLGQTPRQAAYARTRERLATESEGTTAEIDRDLKAGRCAVAAQKIHELTLATGKRCGMLQACATPIVNKLKKQSAKVVDCVNLQPWSD